MTKCFDCNAMHQAFFLDISKKKLKPKKTQNSRKILKKLKQNSQKTLKLATLS